MSSRKSFPLLGRASLALTTLALSAVCSAQSTTEAATPEAQPVKMGFEGRYRFERSVEKDLTNKVEFMSMRLRPSLTYTLSPKATAYVQAQYVKVSGLGTYVPSGGATNTFTETSGNSGYDDVLQVHQAYLDLKFTDNLQFVGGRQELVYGDQYILAASSWGLYGRSFDAAKLRYSEGKSFVDVVHAKLAATSTSNETQGSDKSMSGVYASWNAGEMLKAFDLYYFAVNDRRLGTAPGGSVNNAAKSYGVNGARVATQFGDFGLKAEYAQNFGDKDTDFIKDTEGAYMTVVELAYTISEESKSRIALELFSAGKNWTELYPTTHAVLGITDVLGRRNLTGVGLHYASDISEKWNLLADAYMFQRTNTDNPGYGTDSKKAVGDILASTSKDLGMEIDLRAKYKIDKALSFSVGYAVFNTSTFIKDSQSETKLPSYGFAMFEAKL